MQAEIPQSISATPVRWGAFTTPQLGWLVMGSALPYLLLRCHLGLSLILLPSTPWLGAALAFAFGRYEGRRLDAWTADWLLFLVQPHRLHHPQAGASHHGFSRYVEVDTSRVELEGGPTGKVRSLPWVAD
jgi:hypothetical protein